MPRPNAGESTRGGTLLDEREIAGFTVLDSLLGRRELCSAGKRLLGTASAVMISRVVMNGSKHAL